MSLQNILEISPIAQWLLTEFTPDLPEVGGHPSNKFISFDADRGEQPHSMASNIVSSLFSTANDADFIDIAIRKVRKTEDIYFDRKLAGSLPATLGNAVSRRVLFLAGYLDYPPKPTPHQIRVRVRGRLQIWECRKRADAVELRRVS